MEREHRSWQGQPPYRTDVPDFRAVHRARCHCGAIEYEVRAEPVDAKICHCRQCQTLHGARVMDIHDGKPKYAGHKGVSERLDDQDGKDSK